MKNSFLRKVLAISLAAAILILYSTRKNLKQNRLPVIATKIIQKYLSVPTLTQIMTSALK